MTRDSGERSTVVLQWGGLVLSSSFLCLLLFLRRSKIRHVVVVSNFVMCCRIVILKLLPATAYYPMVDFSDHTVLDQA